MSTTEKPEGGRPRGRPKTPIETLRKRGSWLAKKGTRRPFEAGLYESLPDALREVLSREHVEQLYHGHGGPFGPREVVVMVDAWHADMQFSPAVLSMMKAAWERWRGPLLDAYCRKRMADPSWPASVMPWGWWMFDVGVDFGGESERLLIRKKGLLAKIRAVYEPLFKASADVYAGRRWLDQHLRGDGPEGFAL